VKVWIDAQLSPALAPWLARQFEVEAQAVRGSRSPGREGPADLLRCTRGGRGHPVTKDADFVRLQERHGPPPSILWLTAGNTSNVRLHELLLATWPRAIRLLEAGERLVELRGLG